MLTPARPLRELLVVANTVHGRDGHYPLSPPDDLAPGETHDHLDDAEGTVSFLRDHDVELPRGVPTARDLAALRRLRAGIRALAAGDRTAYRRYVDALLAPVRFRARPDGTIEPEVRGWPALVAGLALTLATATDVQSRLGTCGNDDCRWLYLDGSKNRSRRWCEREICGNRANVRRFRARRRRR